MHGNFIKAFLKNHFMRIYSTLLLILTISLKGAAQQYLKPDFDAEEYYEVCLVNNIISGFEQPSIPPPAEFQMIYKSSPSPLDNVWSYWKSNKRPVGMIVIRGTSGKGESWLENFYAAMIPATGQLDFIDGKKFNYQLADRPDAAVHVGWTLGFSYMKDSLDLLIKAEMAAGINEFIVTGHSQGGAIAYILATWLKRAYPGLTVKVYCSAAPKPGNTGFAYDFEFLFRGGWAFNIVNELDWVPEVPFSIQTMQDFNKVNPFANLRGVIKKQKVPVRWALKKYYNDLAKSSEKAQRKFQKRLGKTIGKFIIKADPNATLPVFATSHQYARTGQPVVLKATEEYNSKYLDENGKKIFVHHSIVAYMDLLKYWYLKK